MNSFRLGMCVLIFSTAKLEVARKRRYNNENFNAIIIYWSKARHIIIVIGHLHDGVILLPRPECFVKMLSYPNLSPPLGRKRQLLEN